MKYIYILFLLGFAFLSAQQRNVFDVARNGTIADLKALMEKNPDTINSVNNMTFTPLILACYRGNTQVAKFLIENVKDVNYMSSEGTALAALAINYNKDLVIALLKNKANPNLKDSNGATPLFWAVKRANAELIKILLENGADKNIHDNFGFSAFEYALKTNNTDIINLLKSK